jgi:hypothetical protein
MKTCPYCGEKYPDDATVCPIDGRELPDLDSVAIVDRKKVAGVWRGVYGYGERKQLAGMAPVAFTLKLKQGWSEHFTGSVTEDTPRGVPGTGTIDGYYKSPTIEFTKQMPVGYVTGPDGTLITLREYLIANGHPCGHELPSALIFYRGTFLDTNRVQGTWLINPQRFRLPGSDPLITARVSGFWCAEFVTDELKVDPTGGPTEALFDKTLLSPGELEDVEGVPFLSLGKFPVADTGKILERFGQKDIRFQIKGDDLAMLQMAPTTENPGGDSDASQMIEVFVHPDDEEKALEITGDDKSI